MNKFLFTFFVFASTFLHTLSDKIEEYHDFCEPIYVEYGHYSPYQDFIPVNSVITYYCDAGYKLVGPETLRCLPNKWDKHPPICQSETSTATCPRQLEELPNGEIEQPDGDRPLNPGERIWYTCNPHYNLVGAQDVTCLDNGQWNYPHPSCEPAYIPCPAPHPPQYGSYHPEKEHYKFGDKIFYSCGDDYQLYGSDFSFCTAHGTWSYPVPICKPRTCRNLIRPENGNFNPQLLKYKIGTKVYFNCIRNYRLVGEKSLVCQKNGEWSDVEPQCERVGCQPVEAPENGALNPEKDIYDVGEKVFFQCDENFVLSGSSPIVCLKNEQFSDEPPTCIPQQCTRPTIANGILEEDKEVYDVDETVTFICDDGFKRVGVETVQCQADGQWSDAFPLCVALQCERPEFDNGVLDDDKDVYDYQESVTFTCNPGYNIEGNDVVTCVGDNVWSDDFPICIAVQCSRPLFEDGTITEDKENYEVGEQADFTCNSGFSIQGADSLICQDDGTWSDEFPVCIPNECARPTFDNGRLEEDKPLYSVGETVDFFCDVGYTLQGPQTLTCEESSEWSDDFPVCVPVTCERPTFNNGELNEDKQFYDVGEVVEFSCVTGYYLDGVDEATCLPSGQFSEPIPECLAITCSRPQIDNSILTEDEPTYGFEVTVLVQCQSGFMLNGANVLQCVANEEWSPEFPTCDPIFCQRPEFNGDLIEDQETYAVGETVRFDCPDGTVLQGNEELECLATGQFSGEIPNCQRLTCSQPFIDNGDFQEKQDQYFPNDVVDFQCIGNFFLVGESTLTCQNDGEWDFDFPTCQEYTCEQPSIENGGFNPVQDSYVIQSAVNFFCDEGYSISGETQLICEAQGQWSDEFPTCVPNTCEEPVIDNGSFEEVQDEYNVGDSVVFSCDEGYSIMGALTIVCESNGQWSENFPTCKAVRCEKPGLNDGVTVNPNKNLYEVGESITYSCPLGTTLIGEDSAECLSSGEFSNDSPFCQENMCDQPTIENGSFDPIKETYDVTDSVTFTCDVGFMLVGTQVISCFNNGLWSDEFPTCQPVSCAVPSIEKGQFDPVQTGYTYLDEVTFSCIDGYSLQGAETIQCLENGEWSDEFPVCSANQCGRPVQNSNVARIFPSRTKYDVGTVVKFFCRRGFTLVGSKTSVCQNDGSWSPEEPTCRRQIFCKVRTRPRGTLVNPRRYRYRVGETIKVTCRPGYKISGESTLTCQDTGRFSPDFPTCSRPQRRCRKPFISSKTRITPEKDYYVSGEKVTFSCIKFFEIKKSAKNTATCVNGRWSNSVPSCILGKPDKKFESCKGRCAKPFASKPCFCHKWCKYKFVRGCCDDYREYCASH